MRKTIIIAVLLVSLMSLFLTLPVSAYQSERTYYEKISSKHCGYYGCESRTQIIKETSSRGLDYGYYDYYAYPRNSYTYTKYEKVSSTLPPAPSWRYERPMRYEYGHMNYYAPRYDSDLGYYNWRY